MFTGIIETLATVRSVEERAGNRVYRLSASIATEFRVDESVAHNGVCLTVERVFTGGHEYQVTAIHETLLRSSLSDVRVDDRLNLERALAVGGRLDGHFVQGHVDAVGTVTRVDEVPGSREFFVTYPAEFEGLVVPKGSICLDGISLTVAKNDAVAHELSVCIIPHTWEKTNIAGWRVGTKVNVEFDVLGKYVQKMLSARAAG